MGLTRHEWGNIHSWFAYGFIVLILVHLIVHRVWLAKIASANRAWRLWIGLSLGLLLILFLLVYPISR